MMTPLLVKLNAIQVLALAGFGVAMGNWLKGRIRLLDQLHVPAAIAGGLVYAVLALALRGRVLNLEMDLALRDILMVAFFTTLGMSASLRLIREGGRQALVFFAVAVAGAVLQNVLGVLLARPLGLNPLLGLISGSVALTGGPATALAFGSTFEKLGVANAATLGVASAMFGITAGGLIGGYLGGMLIRRRGLRPVAGASAPGLQQAERIVYAGDAQPEVSGPLLGEGEDESSPLLASVIAIAIAMGLGTLVSAGFERLGLVLPAYVGAMIAASVLRNLDDRFRFLGISQHHVDAVGSVALYVFIVMALMALRLWELAALAVPLLVMLSMQVLLAAAMCIFMAFRVMGRDYEAAVMTSGFCGFMLGTTANALACMDVLVRKYGPAPRAFIIVPLVGAFLIDFANALIITVMANLLR
jgi:ESS family glutamate:Na+ symporter